MITANLPINGLILVDKIILEKHLRLTVNIALIWRCMLVILNISLRGKR